MTTYKLGRWVLVVLAVVGLAVAAPVVGAHGNDASVDGAPPYGGTAADWTAWMEGHVTDHTGPGAVEWMESHMGVTVDEMARDTAEGDYADHGPHGHGGMYGQDSGGMYGQGLDGMYGQGPGGMYGQGRGC
jgi:hypothetical protein